MIFEKTLGRKIIGAPKKQDNDKHINGDAHVSESLHPRNSLRKICGQIKGLFKSNQSARDVKEPASMGKILNLMRCVINSYEIQSAH